MNNVKKAYNTLSSLNIYLDLIGKNTEETKWTIEQSLTELKKVKKSDLLHDVSKRNWFEKLPLYWKLLLHTGVGVLLGLTISYVC